MIDVATNVDSICSNEYYSSVSSSSRPPYSFQKLFQFLLCVTAVNFQSLYVIIFIIYLMFFNVALTDHDPS